MSPNSPKSKKKKLEKLNNKKKKDNSSFDLLFLDEEEFSDEYEEILF